MLVQKMGYDSRYCGVNSKVYAIEMGGTDLVLSAPRSCKDAEVGMKLFGRFFMASESLIVSIRDLADIFHTDQMLANYAIFNIALLNEYSMYYRVNSCGSVILIKVNKKNEFSYEYLDCEEDPPYASYNYMRTSELSKYTKAHTGGARFKINVMDKSDFNMVGVATPALAEIIGSNLKDTFESLFVSKNILSLNRMFFMEVAKKNLRGDIALALR